MVKDTETDGEVMAALRPCDTRTSHRMHPWGDQPPHYVCPGVPMIGPDCGAGKHLACDGRAWDDEADTITRCICDCHKENT